jgi:hypothetical protein
MICKKCNIDKYISNFRIKTGRKNEKYRSHTCRKCYNEYDRTFNPVKTKSGYFMIKARNKRIALTNYYVTGLLRMRNPTKELIELKRQLIILKRNIHEYIQRSDPNGY